MFLDRVRELRIEASALDAEISALVEKSPPVPQPTTEQVTSYLERLRERVGFRTDAQKLLFLELKRACDLKVRAQSAHEFVASIALPSTTASLSGSVLGSLLFGGGMLALVALAARDFFAIVEEGIPRITPAISRAQITCGRAQKFTYARAPIGLNS